MNLLKAFFKATLYKPLFNLLIVLVAIIPGHSVGWAIIALTLLVRLALYPLNASMIRSQQALSALQPEIERIRTEFKDDQQAQAKATLELYQARKINPFGSCLLLAVQLPVLWVLYRVFTVGLDTSRFDLLYAVTPRPELIQHLFFGLDLTHPSIVLGILAGAAQFAQSWQSFGTQLKSASTKGDPAAGAQQAMTRQMVYIFPLLTVFLAARFPAALTLYWLTTTLAMVAQQAWMNRSKVTLATIPEVSVTVRTK